jgi:putative addiction module killer protein
MENIARKALRRPQDDLLAFGSFKTTLRHHWKSSRLKHSASGESGSKDNRARALIAARINRPANGLAGDAQPVGEGGRELRIHYGPGHRVYFQQRGTLLVILLCGGKTG